MRQCFYHTALGQNAVFHNSLQYKVHSFNIQDDRSEHAWAFTYTEKPPRQYIWSAGSHFCRASRGRVRMNINGVKLQT